MMILSIQKVNCKAYIINPNENYDFVRYYYYNYDYSNPYSYYYDYKNGGFIDYNSKYEDNCNHQKYWNNKKYENEYQSDYYKDYYKDYYDFKYYDKYYDYLEHNYYID